jgi:hypothetical protein
MSSSRRTNGEINILAMLDGHAPGRRIFARPAVLWYGAAGVAACSLLVVLAWLVRGETPARDTPTATAATATAAARSGSHDAETSAYAARDSIQVAVPSMHTAPAEDILVRAPARGAIVVDVAPPAPAMVPAPTAATPMPAAPAHTATHYTPVHPQASRPAPSLAHADPASRQKRAASRAPSSATVDTDVALISAILQHTGTRDEAAEGTGTAPCADKSCKPRLPSRQ